ncbi:malonyl-CoA-acyl carrier protein transacylase mitochondrial [Biomphalaria pfeifferi]|uniref:[acyl-carrier-protein] S-malonyltransferase n=1 Tax=Biomphalaria pfeifferi TaxID=112525 RepID=A0AAD8F249_BIOPF|nr:malonyl-CoA-acyl carrier protein transacylase mitochondrial [Biomphalaria pfeifferi]
MKRVTLQLQRKGLLHIDLDLIKSNQISALSHKESAILCETDQGKTAKCSVSQQTSNKCSYKLLQLKPCKTNSKRNFSSNNGSASDGTSDGSNTENVVQQKLPRRVLKRLHKQGVSEEQFISKLNSTFENMKEQRKSIDKKDKLEDLLKSMSTEPRYLSETDNFPSDLERHRQWEKQKKLASIAPKKSPSQTSVILFPGQGSQVVGMGKKLLPFPRAHDLYEEASSLLGFDLLKICLNGPKSELDKTKYCQPAVVITSLAAIEKFKEEHPQALESCVATAGFSVGEFAALVFCGVLSFPDAVKLVKVRAEAMQKASEMVASGMLSVFLAHDSNLSLAIKTAKDYCQERRGIENPVCVVANYLFPECKVIAGHEEAIEFLSTNAKEFGILRTKRLAVSGAFHTNLMESAVQPLQRALAGMKIGSPKFTVYSNVTNAPYHLKTNFAHMLGQQLVKPVKWEQIMHNIYSRDKGVEFPNTYEIGPGRQMGTFLKQVNLQAHKQYHNVEV